jgi:hypothetical protein
MVVFPGGGFQLLAMDLEGTEICDWMTAKGIICVLLKYRVPKGNHYWDKDCDCHITPKATRALQDAKRTIRLVRARAKELNLDPNKIGVVGFSAGGYLVAQTSNIFEPTYKPVDAVDKLSSRSHGLSAFERNSRTSTCMVEHSLQCLVLPSWRSACSSTANLFSRRDKVCSSCSLCDGAGVVAPRAQYLLHSDVDEDERSPEDKDWVNDALAELQGSIRLEGVEVVY